LLSLRKGDGLRTSYGRGWGAEVSDDWQVVTLGTVLPFRYGKGLPERNRTNDGKFRVVSSAGFTGRHSTAITSGPSVVIGRKGSIGTVHFCQDPVFPIDTTFYVEASEVIDIRFAYYLLKTLSLSEMNNDSAVPGLNRSQAEALEVSLPPLAEQRGIAATLGALDDKIESNRRIITLVPNLISKHVLGALSEASDTISVSQLAYFINGGAYTKGATGYGRMVIRIAELNSGPGDSTVYNDLDVGENQLARPGDILMSWSGSLGLYRWFRDEAIINQHIFKVISWVYPDWLIFDRLQSVMGIFRGIAQDKATTMGHIQRGHLDSTTVMIPSEESIRALDQKLAPLWAKLLLAERENLKLVALRDALLPELLSGRIRVPEAQGAVEAVV